MNEFEIIRRYFTRGAARADVLTGIGDDAAVLRAPARIAVTVDTLLEGVHFPAGAPADAVGHRALAVSLSDLAAMGARPCWATLALTLPAADPAWLEAFAAGFFALAERFDVALVGGNLTRGPLSITVEATGAFADGVEPLTRAGGRSGDAIFVTGTLGDAAGGLERLRRNGEEGPLVARYLRPTPRVDAGVALARLASAAIDISDGLAADLGHLCEASECGAIVELESLPISDELVAQLGSEGALRAALSGSDDYELCFTVRAERAGRVEAVLAGTGTSARRIGRLVERSAQGSAIRFLHRGNSVEPAALGAGGYLHFQ